MFNIFKRKYDYLSFVIILIFLLSLFTTSAKETQINICCTNSILADFTNNLIKEDVNIEYIMPAGICPTHFDTSPSDISKIKNSDIIISLGIEPWLNSLIESSDNSDYKIIECKGLGQWNIPSGAKKYVEKLKNELSLILPEINDSIKSNSQTYMNHINDTADQLLNIINSKQYQNKSVICMQWHADFINWLGLDVIYSYGPPESLSMQDMINISNIANNREIYAIIDNLQSGTDFGARIALESDSSHIVFTNFPKAFPDTDSYLDMIIYNTEKLVDGISSYEDKQGEISVLENTISSIELQRNFSLFGMIIFGLLASIFIVLYKRK